MAILNLMTDESISRSLACRLPRHFHEIALHDRNDARTTPTYRMSKNSALVLLAASLATCSLVTTSLPSREPPETQLKSISIGAADLLSSQSLPLTYVKSWPLWMAGEGAAAISVRRVEAEDADGAGWVNPVTFEQLWLPIDLPLPTARAAIACVLKDGVPRYFMPTIETSITSPDDAATKWYNRGLNSLPMAKTWLPFGEVDVDAMRISCYCAPLPDDDGDSEEADGDEAAAPRVEWEQVLPLTAVKEAVGTIFEIMADAPDDLGSGFCYVVVPLAAALPPSAVSPGQRLRLFLSDVDATPTALDPEDRESWVWNRGECELEIYHVAAGGDSDFLPDAYRPLFGAFPRTNPSP